MVRYSQGKMSGLTFEKTMSQSTGGITTTRHDATNDKMLQRQYATTKVSFLEHPEGALDGAVA